MSARRAGSAGLTLLEIVMSMAVLSLVLLGVFSSMASSMRHGVLTREHMAASEEAVRQLDSYATDPNLAFATAEYFFPVQVRTGRATAGNLTPADPLPTDGDGTWDQPTMPGRVRVEVNPKRLPSDATGMGSDIVRITATVAYKVGPGRNERVELVTLRAR